MRRVGILAVEGVQLLDVGGPADVFAEANVQAGCREYEIVVLGATSGAIRTSSGMRLIPDEVIGSTTVLDTLLVAGAPRLGPESGNDALGEKLRAVAGTARRYGSVCTGAFLLAGAGLLDGRRVTTHWAAAERLAAAFPNLSVEPDEIFVRDGKAYTSAGVTAGLDLALLLVEEDLGLELARGVASRLVMYFRRPGGQLQYSRRQRGSPAGRSALQEMQRWVISNPEADHSVTILAERTGLSPRHFARLFRQELKTTPSAWVEGVRVEAACRHLEQGLPPKVAGIRSGFANVETFRRAFRRHVGISPAAYRSRQV